MAEEVRLRKVNLFMFICISVRQEFSIDLGALEVPQALSRVPKVKYMFIKILRHYLSFLLLLS